MAEPNDTRSLLSRIGQILVQLFLILINIILLTILLFFTVKWFIAKQDALRPSEHELCVRESQLFPADNCTGFEMRQDEGVLVCCGLASRILHTLVQKHTKATSEEDIFVRAVKSSRNNIDCTNSKIQPAIKVHSPIADNFDNHYRLRWTSVSLNRTGIIEHNGTHLKVRQTGYYYIYSQVEFGNLFTSGLEPETMIHYVHHRSANTGQEVKLLESSRSRTKTSHTGTIHSSSFTGAVFLLDEDDKLFVHVSHPDSVTENEDGNFFGAYLLD